MRERQNVTQSSRLALATLLCLALVRGTAYATLVPPWQSPDETGHFEYAWLIAHLGRLPTREDASPALERELLGSLYEWRYGRFTQPLPERMPGRMEDLTKGTRAQRSRSVLMNQRFSLAYLWTALFIMPFRHQDLVFQLYAARLASVVAEVGIVWLAWHIFKRGLPGREGAVIAMTGFVVFLPQHTFINASVNEGALAELAACAVIYGWVRIFEQQGRAIDVVTIIGGTLVGMWSKRTAAFLLPFDTTMLFLLGSRRKRAIRRRHLKYAIPALTLVLLAALTLRSPLGQLVDKTLHHWLASPQVYLKNERTSLTQALWQTLDSFWALFGWGGVRAGDGWYVAVYLLIAAAIEGWLLPRSPSFSRSKTVLGVALLTAVGTWLAFLLLSPSGLNYRQGRYLFPATVPAAFFIVGGWARWMPGRWHRYLAPITITLMSVLDATAFFLAALPFFYAG